MCGACTSIAHPGQPAAIARTRSRDARHRATAHVLLDTRLDSIPIAQRLSSGFVQYVFCPPRGEPAIICLSTDGAPRRRAKNALPSQTNVIDSFQLVEQPSA